MELVFGSNNFALFFFKDLLLKSNNKTKINTNLIFFEIMANLINQRKGITA